MKHYLRLKPGMGKVVLGIVWLSLLLTACGGPEFAYHVEGTAVQATILYRDQDGNLRQLTTSLPWEQPLRIGSPFDFMVEATNTADSGVVICSVVIDGRTIGSASGSHVAGCVGTYDDGGEEPAVSFEAHNDVRVN